MGRFFTNFFDNDFKDTSRFNDGVKNLFAYANYYDFNSNSVTTIETTDTWVKMNSNTVSGFTRNGVVHTNNRLTNTGSTKIFDLSGIASIQAGNNDEIHVAFFKNGVLFPCSEQSIVTSSGGKRSGIPFRCLIELEQNDFIEVYVKNKLSTTNITLGNLNVILKEL